MVWIHYKLKFFYFNYFAGWLFAMKGKFYIGKLLEKNALSFSYFWKIFSVFLLHINLSKLL